jgi:hypothetical protein
MLHTIKELINSGYNRPLELTAHQKLTLTYLGFLKEIVKVDICLFLRGEFSITSLYNIIETWLQITKMPYRFEINANNSKIIIEHAMGYKYSFLIREITRYIMEVGFEARTSCDFTDNTVIIKLNQ